LQIDFGDAKCADELEEGGEEEVPKKDEEGLDHMLETAFESEGDKERRGTFVGTVNYLAPEMIHNNSASMSTDIWSLGCIIYKMLTGNVPFPGTDTVKVYKKILNKEIDYPAYLSPEAVALIDSLIMINPLERLGNPA
jgi:serine/threonine protein kinase